MALRINLNHEIERLKVVRKRDPLKITVWVLGLIGAAMALYYVSCLTTISGVGDEYARTRAEYDRLEPQARAAKERTEVLNVTTRTSSTLIERIEGRFYWAPLLEKLITVIPREVQVTRLTGETSGESLKTGKVTLEGLSCGAEPRGVAEALRTTLVESFAKDYQKVTAKLAKLDESSEVVQLDGQSLPTAVFVIVLEFQSGHAVVVPPPPRKPRVI